MSEIHRPRCLIADDDPIIRRLLSALLTDAGYEVEFAKDGDEAWARLQQADAPPLLLLDWMMPGIDGPEILRRLRARERDRYTYVVVITSRNSSEALVEALELGADDFVRKPFHAAELRARLMAGHRLVGIDRSVLNEASRNLHRICMHCKSIREQEIWKHIEVFIGEHLGMELSHSICPICLQAHYADLLTPAPGEGS